MGTTANRQNTIRDLGRKLTEHMLDDDDITGGAHDFALQRMGLSPNTKIGGDQSDYTKDDTFLADDDPREQVYYSLYNDYVLAVAAEAIRQLLPPNNFDAGVIDADDSKAVFGEDRTKS